MPAFGRGFLFAALCPRGCAPLEPRQGVPPCTARLTSASGGPAGGLSPRGRGAGGRAPPTPCRQAWVAPVASRGRVLAPAGAAGRTNPLTRPSLEKRARGPRRGRRALSEWMGVKARGLPRPRNGLALTPRNDPNAPGWWLGCFSPSRLPRGERPRRAAGGALDLLLLRAVSEKQLSAPSALRDWLWLWL